MSTHEFTVEGLTWTEATFSDTEEARGALRWLQEQLEDETDPQRRSVIESDIDEISELLFQEMFDLL